MIVGSDGLQEFIGRGEAAGRAGGALRAGGAFRARRLDDRVDQLRRRCVASSAASPANALPVERGPAAQQRAGGNRLGVDVGGGARAARALRRSVEPASSISHTFVTGGQRRFRIRSCRTRRVVEASWSVPAFDRRGSEVVAVAACGRRRAASAVVGADGVAVRCWPPALPHAWSRWRSVAARSARAAAAAAQRDAPAKEALRRGADRRADRDADREHRAARHRGQRAEAAHTRCRRAGWFASAGDAPSGLWVARAGRQLVRLRLLSCQWTRCQSLSETGAGSAAEAFGSSFP